MSIPVPLEELSAQLAGRTRGYLITTSPAGLPHVAHQPVRWDETTGTIVVPAGGSTRRNVNENASMCLLFPADEDSPDSHSLIIDGSAKPDQPSEEHLRFTPSHAVLHRPAPAAIEGP